MVEVFKTNVESQEESNELIRRLHVYFPECKINFDLDDCDKILRIEGSLVCPQKISEILCSVNYTCELLL